MRLPVPSLDALMLGLGVGLLCLGFGAVGIEFGFLRQPAPLAAHPEAAPYSIHYSPAESLEPIDVALIDDAAETIDMAAYVLTDFPIIDALADAAARGVKIRIWREASEAAHTDSTELAKLTAQPNIQIRIKPRGDWMHLKSYCVDGAVLRSGAANFSASGEKRQDNDLVVLRDPAACAAFTHNFETMWGQQ